MWPHDFDPRTPFHTVGPRWCPPGEIFMKLFSLENDGETFGMDVDGSVSGGLIFKVVVPVSKVLLLKSLSFHMVDGKLEPAKFGDRTALTNGVTIHVHDEAMNHLVNIAEDQPLKTNTEFAGIGIPVFYEAGVIDESMIVTVDFVALTGYAMMLQAGNYIAVHINDDLSLLSHFDGVVYGRLVNAVT